MEFESSPSARPWHRGFALATIGIALLATGCGDDERVIALEESLATLESDTRKLDDEAQLAIETLESQRDQLLQRLEQAELQVRTALEQSDNLMAEHGSRFESLEAAFTSLARHRENLESMAYLPVGFQNHSTLGTAHGTFLVRLDGVARANASASPNADYLVTLKIGNPLGLSVKEFTLRGHFGSQRPESRIGEDDIAYRQRFEAWEKSLVPFQHMLLDELSPGSWTSVVLPLRSPQPVEIEMLRFTMTVERAFLDNLSGAGELAVISATTESTAIAQTPYGAFLVNTNGVTPQGTGMRVNLAIGNPFIMTINQVRLKGEFGPRPPKRQDGENLPVFASRLEDWQLKLKPFETTIETPILPGRWNDASILMPTSDLNELGYIRFNFTPEAAFLPIPPGADGPQ